MKTFGTLLKNHTRLETFFTPYATGSVGFPLYAKNFLALWWDVVGDPPTKTPNSAALSGQCLCPCRPSNPPNSARPIWGKSLNTAPNWREQAQYVKSPGNTPSGFFEDGLTNPSIIAAITFDVIEPEVADGQHVAFGPVADRRRASHFHVLLHSAARPRRCRARKSVGRPGCRFADRHPRRQFPHRGADGVPLRQGWRHSHVGDVHRKSPKHLVRQLGPDRLRQEGPKTVRLFSQAAAVLRRRRAGMGQNGRASRTTARCTVSTIQPRPKRPIRRRSTRTSWPTFAGVVALAWMPSPPTARASIPRASSTTNSCSRCWSHSTRHGAAVIVAGRADPVATPSWRTYSH